MNGIYAFCGVAVCLACIGAVIKQLKQDWLPIYSAACAVVCGAYVFTLVTPVVKYVSELTADTVLPRFFSLLIKTVGVSLLCGAASDICRACGENSLASAVEGAGRALMVLLSLPVVGYLLEAAVQLMD